MPPCASSREISYRFEKTRPTNDITKSPYLRPQKAAQNLGGERGGDAATRSVVARRQIATVLHQDRDRVPRRFRRCEPDEPRVRVLTFDLRRSGLARNLHTRNLSAGARPVVDDVDHEIAHGCG